MSKLSFSTKMSLMLLFSCLVVATLVAGVAVYQQMAASRASLEALRKTLYTDYDHTAKTQVEMAISLLKGFHPAFPDIVTSNLQ
jgi:CHASE3 domain sensor protein